MAHSCNPRERTFFMTLIAAKRSSLKSISIACTKARTRDRYLVHERQHLFCKIVGGVISPLLMNIALHGMEGVVSEGYSKSHAVEKPLLVRYADDFVIFHSSLEELEKVICRITQWLQEIGLSLSPKKTRITHILTPYEGQRGFDFLGFVICQFPVGKTHTGKNTKGKALGFKTIIKPSKEAVRRHILSIKDRLRKLRSVSQEQLIKELNPVIWGWAAYYKTSIASETFSRCDDILWRQLMQGAQARHSNKGKQWVVKKYWYRREKRNWVFVLSDDYYCRWMRIITSCTSRKKLNNVKRHVERFYVNVAQRFWCHLAPCR